MTLKKGSLNRGIDVRNAHEDWGEMVHTSLWRPRHRGSHRTCKVEGAIMLEEEPIVGAHGVRIAFFALEGLEDVAFELVESKPSEHGTFHQSNSGARAIILLNL